MTQNRLFAFGCSHTFGYALPDVVQYMQEHQGEIYPTKFGKNHSFGSRYAWPQVLAKRLNLECYNYGCCGASGTETVWLFTQCLQHDMISAGDTVVVQWPSFQRTGIFYQETGTERTGTPSRRFWPGNLEDKKATVFYYDYYDEYDFAVQRWREIILVDLVCQARGIRCYHMLVNEELGPEAVELETLTQNIKIDFVPIDYNPGDSPPWIVDTARDGHHYGVESHKLIADKWEKFICPR